jgi:putative MATE family efflux protein
MCYKEGDILNAFFVLRRRNMQGMRYDFDKTSVRRLAWQLGIPAMLAQLFNILYSIVDRIYIGHMPNGAQIALASVGICAPAFTAVTGFASLVGVGGAALMSISMGEKDSKTAQQALNNALLLLLLFSVGVTAGLLLFQKPLLYMLGCSDAMYPTASSYFKIYTLRTGAVLCGTGLNRFIMGQAYAKHGMLSVVVGALLNIILDPIFIYILHLGIVGAAVATILSQFGVLLYVLWVFHHISTPIRIGFGRYNWKICSRILGIGSMSFLIIFLDNFLIILLNAMLRNYGGALGDRYISCNGHTKCDGCCDLSGRGFDKWMRNIV